MDEPHRATRIYKPLLMAVSLSTLVAFAGCASDELTQVPETGEASQALGCDDGPPAVGLALEIENGAGVPLKVKKGQRFYVNQQATFGDRHVYASRTRFIGNSLLPHFEQTCWPPPADPPAALPNGRLQPVDLAARMRGMWS